MTTGPLTGLRIVESSAFIAAPVGGMTLAQLGADVVRVDPIQGGVDYGRWPLAPNGNSIYWASLNRGKRSVALDFRSAEGRELAMALITAPGREAGILVSNFPARGWLADDALRARRPDLIYVSIVGNPDGSTALDYTVGAASGFPSIGGQPGDPPVNQVVPAWDLATALYAALGILSAERTRARTGVGEFIEISLANVAFSMATNMGYAGQVQHTGATRPALGNYVYGAFGRDFETSDGRRIMVCGISANQWETLVAATSSADEMDALGKELGLDLAVEGDRFLARERVAGILEPWFCARPLAEAAEVLDIHGACWAPYQTFEQAVHDDWRMSERNPLFGMIDQPGIGPLLTPRSPLAFRDAPQPGPLPAPVLGQHTDEVLSSVLGRADTELTALHERGVIAGPRAED